MGLIFFCVCVCRATSQAGQLHISILATRILNVFIQIQIHVRIYIYKCDNVYMLPMSVWDVSWSFHQVLRNWLCEHFTFVTQPRDWWSQWLIVLWFWQQCRLGSWYKSLFLILSWLFAPLKYSRYTLSWHRKNKSECSNDLIASQQLHETLSKES